jgi:hypothetical protein
VALSERIRTILDPVGPRMVRHSTRNAESPPMVRAECYLPHGPTRRWAVTELDAVGAESVEARAFGHLVAAIRARTTRVPRLPAGAAPALAPGQPRVLVVLDYDAVSATDISTLASARWSGFTGSIVLLARTPVQPRLRALLEVDLVIGAPFVDGTLAGWIERMARR